MDAKKAALGIRMFVTGVYNAPNRSHKGLSCSRFELKIKIILSRNPAHFRRYKKSCSGKSKDKSKSTYARETNFPVFYIALLF